MLLVLMEAFPKLGDGISGVISAFNGKGGGLKGALSATKAGFSGLFNIVKAHPFAALTTAITIGAIALQKYREAQEEYQKQQREIISTAEENIQKYEEEKSSLLSLQSRLDEAKGNKTKLLSLQNELNDAIGETPGLVQDEGNAYNIASEKIKSRIKDLENLIKAESEAKIAAQKEIFATNTTPYEFGIDALDTVGLNIDVKEAAEELKKFQEQRQKAIELGSDEDSIGIRDYDKKIARYKGILQGKVSEAQEVFADFIDVEFEDAIGKSYVNKYIEDLIFGGEDNLDNIKSKLQKIKPAIDEFNSLKNDLIDNQINKESTDDVAVKLQNIIDTIKTESPQLADLMQSSLDSLIPDENIISEGIKKIKETFSNSLKDENSSENLQEFNDFIDNLSEEDKEIIYKIYCDTDTAKYSLQDWQNALNDYKTNTESIPIRSKILSLWESEGFASAKESLIEMADTIDGISPQKIKELAEESEELATILEIDGMNAEFLANVLTFLATGNDGLSLITDDALKLNEVLSGMTDAFDEVTTAKEKYDAAMSVEEKDTNFKSIAEAYETLNQQFTEGKTNSNAFWAASEFIFGTEKLKEFGYNVDEIYKSMAKNASIFKDADSAGFGFLDKLYAMSKSGKVLDDAGNVIAEISKLSNGSYDIDIDYENIDKIADSMDLSREAVLSCLEAISMFGDIDFYDIEEVARVIEEIGIATEVEGEKVINADALIDKLVALGKTEKEIESIINNLVELDNVTLLDAEMEVDNLIVSLENLGMISKDGAKIEVEYTSLTDLMKEIGFTKKQAEMLITKLGEVDGIRFTKQLGSGGNGVTDVQNVLDYINSMDFSSAEGEVGTVTSAVKNLTNTLNGLNGKSISVKIDIIGSIKDLFNVKGKYAKGTKGAVGGASLVGENGEELVKSGDRAYFVGTNGAEIVNLNPGDTVYTASETKRIKNSSKHFTGTIPAYAGGTYGTVGKKEYASVLPDKKSKEDKIEAFDWIEVAIDRIEHVIDRLKKTAESTYKSLKSKLGAAVDEISMVNQEIAMQQQAFNRYMQEANSVGLSSSLKEKVRTGEIDISQYNEDTRELIKNYSEWYEKALNVQESIDDLHESLASLYEDNFNNTKDDFENQLELAEHLVNQYQNGIDLLEARGYLESTKYYSAMQDATKSNIAILNNELSSLEKSFSDAMNSGEIEEYSEAWYSMQTSINDVKEEIAEANIELAEYAKTMREIEWGYFDYTQDRISQLTQESEFLIDLLSNSDLHTDKGQLTDEGMATMGLHAQNYNVYMAQADAYAEEILSIDKELANDPYNTELIERREELLGLQQDSILAAEDEKQAIISLVEEGINLELESLQELINSYTESLDSARDLYEYQKKIESQTQNIASLQKQLSAYENDLSEETRAKVQKLTVELADAQEELEQTEYEKMVSDTKKLLDELYLEYSSILNQRLDNVDALIGEMITSVNDNAGAINETITTASDNVGYTMTESMQNIWNSAISSSNGVVSKYGDDFSFKLTSIQAVLGSIQANTAAMIDKSDKQAEETIKNTTTTTTPTPSAPTNKPATATLPPAKKSIVVGGKINAGSAKIYDYVGDTSGENQYYSKDPIYTVLDEKNGYLKVRHHKLSSGVTGWFKKSDVKAYKTGGLVDYTGLAQVDGTPGKPELMLNSEDTANFLELRDLLRVLSSQSLSVGSSYGFGSPVLNGVTDISRVLSALRSASGGNMGTTIGDIEINIPIERVDDYNDFVTKLQKDKNFENMMLSMTLDRIAGGSSLDKHKYKWK